MRKGMVFAAMVVCCSMAASGALAGDLDGWSPGEDCSWKGDVPEGIRVYEWNASYIAPPAPGMERGAWLDAMRNYRDAARAGTLAQVIDLDFRGVRAWTRLDAGAAKALDVQAGETLHIEVEARWIAGNNELCVAFDIHRRAGDAPAGWTGVRAALDIPRDGAWHGVKAQVRVPERNDTEWLRPIVGMDATHDAAVGRVLIRAIALRVENVPRMAAMRTALENTPGAGIDRSLYDAPAVQWLRGAVTCHFTFMYDRSFYDPERGEYTLDSFLEDGLREFGGYDILLLWHAYPRIGVDARNQLDFYRDMPGGVPGLREIVSRCHVQGVRVFINYNPWDAGTAREAQSDEDFLVEFVAATDVDGIFLDTMMGDSPVLRAKLEAARPGIVLCPEGTPPLPALGFCAASWAQWQVEEKEAAPSLPHRKWLEPRHQTWQIWRWMPTHRDEIRRAFFNGAGMLVWENVFGTHNPWPIADRRLWRRCAPILRRYSAQFSSDAWEPFHPKAAPGAPGTEGLFIHRWPGETGDIYTLWLRDAPAPEYGSGRVMYDSMAWPLFDAPGSRETRYFDLWNGHEIFPESAGDVARIQGFIDRFAGLGCFAALREETVDADFLAFLDAQRAEADRPAPQCDPRNNSRPTIAPAPVPIVPPVDTAPPGMVFAEGGEMLIHIEHQRRECGCYPDPGAPADQWEKFTWGDLFDTRLTHDYTTTVPTYYIDEAEVTNAQYNTFLHASGYRPAHPENFLKHWPNAEMPPELAELPVVYVDLDDARAYAAWAGKRLPSEEEWQLAAQGRDGRVWPWGNTFEETYCADGKALPVRSLPAGKSPSGCYHLAGNVWEWTESERDDGHTRYAMLRGGCWFRAKGSGWYFDGGPQPCDHHAKFIRMWPGLDRCETIGFRCVSPSRP